MGYTDDGAIATHALVFMVRGLRTKSKQASICIFAFFFTAPKLTELISECIDRLCEVGLIVRCIICDQGATNMAAVRNLGCTGNNLSFTRPCLSQVVYVIYDAPHLLKSVRNNFVKHDVMFDNHTARWKHIAAFYQLDKASSIRLAPKLTDRHIDFSNQAKTRVCLAAQVLSHSVAAGLQARVVTKLPDVALGTALFVEQVDKLFDMLNSRKKHDATPAKCALTADNDNIKTLMSLKDWVCKWTFVGARAPTAIKCHQGLLVSVQILCLCHVHY